MNARSLRNKSTIFQDFVHDNKFDIVAVTETWLTSSDDAVVSDLTPPGFKFLHHPRISGRGGGVGLLYRDNLSVVINKSNQYPSFESLSAVVSNDMTSFEMLVIYRPPGFQSFSMFINDCSDLLDDKLYKASPLVIVGDLNIHLDNVSSQHTQRFNDLVDGHGLHQLVSTPTHDQGHILDPILVRNSERRLYSRLRVIPGISDHSAVTCLLHFRKPKRTDTSLLSRNIKGINRTDFANDVSDSNISSSATDNIDDAVTRYNSVLIRLLDSHAPARTRKAKSHQSSPWYNSEISAAKKERRRLERRWRRNGKLQIDREQFCTQRDQVNYLVSKAKRSYHTKLIEDCGADNKKLFNVANRLLNRNQSSPLPKHTDGKAMAESFIDYFNLKVQKIRLSLSTNVTYPKLKLVTSSTLDTFQPTSTDEILQLLRKLPPKSCPLDPIPTILLKDCALTFAPIISEIINRSIDEATVPSALKLALIRPLLKKPSLDCESLKNYRPVSNLPFLLKILERVVFSRLTDYLLEHDLLDRFQSAYRPHHSVETLLTNVSSFILQKMDSGLVTAMVLLDLSAAFDTVDHTLLINTLTSLGVQGKALQWLKSYLSFHSQSVILNGVTSSSRPLVCGVPQGSVGGPTLFSIYLTGLQDIFQRHSVHYHLYADDIQIYVSFSPNQTSATQAIRNLERCIMDIDTWLKSNSLLLNQSKCEFLLFGSKSQLSKLDIDSISISGNNIPLSESCRNLGVIFDSHMSMSKQITSICSSVRYQLRNIGFIRKYLTRSATEKLVHSLISSRLDFGNGLLYSLPDSQIGKLQKLQNAAARIVTFSSKRSHITNVLKSLYWLPLKERLVFQILLFGLSYCQWNFPKLQQIFDS